MHAGCHADISAKPLKLRSQGASATAIIHRRWCFSASVEVAAGSRRRGPFRRSALWPKSSFENLLAIVMEPLKGSFPREILPARPKLPMEENLAILSQIAEGLDWAHERGIIHSDPTPAGILVQEGDWARLTDFRIVYISRRLWAIRCTWRRRN
jgi:serine/threonine protein kinase